MEARHREARFFAGLFMGVAALILSILPLTTAFADPVADARAALDAAESQMLAIVEEYEALSAEVESLQAQIDETAAQTLIAQEDVIAGRERLGETISYDYRSGLTISLAELLLNSSSLEDLIDNVEYIARILDFQAAEVEAQKARKAQLDALGEQLDTQKIEQVAALEALEEKRAEADELVAQASARLVNARAQEAARLHALQEAAGRIQQDDLDDAGPEIDPDADTVDREDAVNGSSPESDAGAGGPVDPSAGWLTGIASAYGGETDPYTPNPGVTATGDVCDDYSMGVAVPMAMPGYRSYFGRTVEICYNGMTVYAIVNDCGGMDGGRRVLDLQPGVWKAFGFDSCQSWGLRTVTYRFL